MRILAFDTATPATTVALSGFGPDAIEVRDDPPPGERPGHVSRLLPLIDQVLGEAGAGWDALDRIAVGTGPGTFTGLRIGIATARALATAAERPLVGISTLESLAFRGRAHASEGGVVVAVLDARRGEAFAAAWRQDAEVLAAAALAPDRLAAAVAGLGPGAMAVGDGAIAFRGVLEAAGASVPADGSDLHRVTAAAHAELARARRACDPDDVHPEYIRLPDAEIARRAAT
jgi:tRNA threonylcarbamoyladenosine biosynthesis protein TsaB